MLDCEVHQPGGVDSRPRSTGGERLLRCGLAVCIALALALSGEARAEVHTLGSGAATFYLADHGDTVSVFVQGVALNEMLDAMQTIGGPTYSALFPLTRPVTLSVHRISWQELYDRMFMHLNVSYHYRGGRVAHIRSLGLTRGKNYVVPARTSETRSQWLEKEAGGGGGVQ